MMNLKNRQLQFKAQCSSDEVAMALRAGDLLGASELAAKQAIEYFAENATEEGTACLRTALRAQAEFCAA